MAHPVSPRLTLSSLPAALTLVILALLTGCEQRTPEETAVVEAEVADIAMIESRLRGLAEDHARKLPLTVEALEAAVTHYLAEPNEASQETLRSAWLTAHREFSRSLPLVRIHSSDDQLFMIDAWPIEPGFLDSLPQYPDSGIINDATLAITAETLHQQNGITDSSEVSLGFHPIEYYAFVRPVEDFVQTELVTDEPSPIERRRQALATIANELAASVNQLAMELEATIANEAGIATLAYLEKIIAGTRRTAHEGFQQASLIVDTDNGHCEYSQTSLINLKFEVQSLREIFATGSALMMMLAQLDPKTTDNLDNTLTQAITVLDKVTMSEAERARLPLMLSAIGHQLEELEVRIRRPAS